MGKFIPLLDKQITRLVRSYDLEPYSLVIALTPVDNQLVDFYLLCHREPLYKV